MGVTEPQPQMSQINAETRDRRLRECGFCPHESDCGVKDQKSGNYSTGAPRRPWTAWEVFLQESNILAEACGWRELARWWVGRERCMKSRRLERELGTQENCTSTWLGLIALECQDTRSSRT